MIPQNSFSFFVRVIVNKINPKMGFDVFVANLCIADCLTGFYLCIVGSADIVYQGTYLWDEMEWRNSRLCKFAGFLSLLSNEVSALTICCITLDRCH